MSEYRALAHLEQYPPPKLTISEPKISLQGSGMLYGEFEIYNGVDGDLTGTITSMADFISFSPNTFSGNRVRVEYTVDLTGLNGDIQSGAVVTTSGGERVLDFYITANRADVLERDGLVMADLGDFGEYARAHPVEARKLFGRQDFMMWLLNLGYPSMDMYENFAGDPNKERAVDNFLVLNGIKTKAVVLPVVRDLSHKIGLWDDVVTGSVKLKKTAWGFAEARLEVLGDVKWLKLTNDKIASSDFDGQNMAEVHYMVIADKLEGHDSAQLLLNGEHKINIRVTPAAAFEARLDKQSFFFEDNGKLHIKNNTERDIFVDVSCEHFVKFDAKRYLIGQSAEIDFSIKYSNFKTSSLSFKKQLYAETYIQIVAVGDGQAGFSKRLALTLWMN